MIWLLSVFTDMQTKGTRLANLCSRKITQIVQFAHYGTSLDQCLLTWPSTVAGHSCGLMCFASAFRLVQNWWTQRRLKKEFGQKATDAFPQWEKDYNLQPMNTYGLFDEYLEMSMSLPE